MCRRPLLPALPTDFEAETLEVAPSDAQRSYVSGTASRSPRLGILLRSDNGGESWTQSSLELPPGTAGSGRGAELDAGLTEEDAGLTESDAALPEVAGRSGSGKDAGCACRLESKEGALPGLDLSMLLGLLVGRRWVRKRSL